MAAVTKHGVKKAPTEKQLLEIAEFRKKAAFKAHLQFEKAQKRYLSRLDSSVTSHTATNYLYTLFSNTGLNLSGTTRRELKRYHNDYIKEIEELAPSLEIIVNYPHKFIKEITENVQVEKAKRVSIKTIQHLAQNSQDVSDILETGQVIPKRVLNVFTEDDLNIYENRFIMTLIRRLQIFIELRYKYIEEHGDTRNSDVINVKQEIKIEDATYEFEGKLKLTVPSDDEGYRDVNKDLLERLINLRKRVTFLMNSNFMKLMINASPVQDPIQQTNIIRLNYLYNDAFKLWTFINKYDELGITYTVKEVKVDFGKEYIGNINQLALHSLFTIQSEHGRMVAKDVAQRDVKPRISTAILDLDISDERFSKSDLPLAITLMKETPMQREERLKKERTRQIELERKEALKEKARQRAAERKAKALEEAKLKAERDKEKERQKKLAEEERKKRMQEERKLRRQERMRLAKERRDYEDLLKREAELLKEAREKVRKIAQLKGSKRES